MENNNTLDKLNETGACSNYFKTKKTKDFVLNQPYEILGSKMIHTKYGQKIVLMLEDNENYFLPSRFNEIFDMDNHNSIKDMTITLIKIADGKFKIPIFEFKSLEKNT
jgi:hypothetical protein